MLDQVLFAGPWIKRPGEQPTRIVLHTKCNQGVSLEYIVHTQYEDDKGGKHYEQGDYFQVRNNKDAYKKAQDRFAERCRDWYFDEKHLLHLDEKKEE